MVYSKDMSIVNNNPIIVVIIPAFNEASTINATVNSFLELDNISKIVVVDNNSSDGTSELVRSMSLANPRVLSLKEIKQGKGFAIRKAFREIDADYYVMVDADLTYSSNDLEKLIRVARKEQIDLVVGNRIANQVYANQNSRRFHNVGNILIRNIINNLYKSDLQDILSGYRVMSRSFVRGLPIQSRGFELETEMTLHALERGCSIAEVPILYSPRPKGSESKLRTFYDGRKIIIRIFKIFRMYQPLRFFGFASLTLFTAAVLTGIKPINDYIDYRYVYHVPLAILSSSLTVLAVLTLMTAFILDAVADLGAKNFEIHQNRHQI
jgi:glycosyltransferase involved in cell wall biosynthesis